MSNNQIIVPETSPDKTYDEIYISNFKYIPCYIDYEKEKYRFPSENFVNRQLMDLTIDRMYPDTNKSYDMSHWINPIFTTNDFMLYNSPPMSYDDVCVNFSNCSLTINHYTDAFSLLNSNDVQLQMNTMKNTLFYDYTLYVIEIPNNVDASWHTIQDMVMKANAQIIYMTAVDINGPNTFQLPNFTLLPNSIICYFLQYTYNPKMADYLMNHGVEYSKLHTTADFTFKARAEMFKSYNKYHQEGDTQNSMEED